LLATLAVVVVFPGSPALVVRALSGSPVYGKARALVEEARLKQRAAEGDSGAVHRLARSYASSDGYHRFMKGDAEILLDPLVDSGDVTAITLLAWIIRDSDPEQSAALYLRAADLGDDLAQRIALREMGIGTQEPVPFMKSLFDLQRDRPGWKKSFDHYVTLLRDEARSGNESAAAVLDELSGTVPILES
jgi:hypothetical protein